MRPLQDHQTFAPDFSEWLNENTTTTLACATFAKFLQSLSIIPKSQWIRWDYTKINLPSQKLLELYTQ